MRQAQTAFYTLVSFLLNGIIRRHRVILTLLRNFYMSYYQKHVFFCTNQREDGRQCCADAGAQKLFAYAKAKLQALECHGPGKVRINKAGCMDRCKQGPVLVVYPDAVWYHYTTQADIDEILDKHIIKGQIVERLRLNN